MAIKNTDKSFGTVAKTLHWATVILVMASYTFILSLNFFTRATPEWRNVLHYHQWVGFTIGMLTIVRIYWRAANRQPVMLSAKLFERIAASTAHFLLYFFLITMPLTGWAGSKMDRTYLDLVTVPSFFHTPLYKPLITDLLGVSWDSFEKAMDFYHYRLVGPYLLWMLIAVHVSAALFHHFIRRDETLVRMAPQGIVKRVAGQKPNA